MKYSFLLGVVIITMTFFNICTNLTTPAQLVFKVFGFWKQNMNENTKIFHLFTKFTGYEVCSKTEYMKRLPYEYKPDNCQSELCDKKIGDHIYHTCTAL